MQVAARAANPQIEHEWQRQVEQRRGSKRPGLAPMQTRVCKQNGDPANDESNKADRVNPVRYTNQNGVPRSIQSFWDLACRACHRIRFRRASSTENPVNWLRPKWRC